MKKNFINFIILTLMVPIIGICAIMLLESFLGVASVFVLAVMAVAIVGTYTAIENIYNTLQNRKTKSYTNLKKIKSWKLKLNTKFVILAVE